ncbi:MAG: CRISPR-associated RAMP protein Csx7 [Cyanobacteria bacterium P01_C01_bin.120]
MFDVFKNRLEITGILTTVTALRISQGRSLEPIGSDLPVIKDALGCPLIPGSSFKGAMRSRLESFLRGIDESLAANPAIEAEWAITNDRLNGKNGIKKEVEEELERLYPKPEQSSARAGRKDELLTQIILAETDSASLVFGSPWIASKFQVQDLTVLTDDWFGQYQERDGVSIDRDTETAADGKLYDFQVVPAGTPFQFRAVVENAEDWELGLLMVGLHQFESQQIPLGGGRSRGLGVVELEIADAWWMDYRDDHPEELIDYLKRLVSGQRDAHYKLTNDSFKAYKDDWTDALVNYLRQQVATNAAANVEEGSHA